MRLTTSRHARAVLLAIASCALLMTTGACDRASEQDTSATLANQALDTTAGEEDALGFDDEATPRGVVGNLYREPGATPDEEQAPDASPQQGQLELFEDGAQQQPLPDTSEDAQLVASALRKLARQAERERAQSATPQQPPQQAASPQPATQQPAPRAEPQARPQPTEISRQLQLGVSGTTLQPSPRQLQQGVPTDPGTRAIMGGLPGGPLPEGYDGEEATPTSLTLQP